MLTLNGPPVADRTDMSCNLNRKEEENTFLLVAVSSNLFLQTGSTLSFRPGLQGYWQTMKVIWYDIHIYPLC